MGHDLSESKIGRVVVYLRSAELKAGVTYRMRFCRRMVEILSSRCRTIYHPPISEPHIHLPVHWRPSWCSRAPSRPTTHIYRYSRVCNKYSVMSSIVKSAKHFDDVIVIVVVDDVAVVVQS